MGTVYKLDLAVPPNSAQGRRKPLFSVLFEFLHSCIDLLMKMCCVALLSCLQNKFVSQSYYMNEHIHFNCTNTK